MNMELLEKTMESQDAFKEYSYEGYSALGGIINEKDYNDSIARIDRAVPKKESIRQAIDMAKILDLEIEPTSEGGRLDPRIVLYGILRDDSKLAKVEYHHSQMNDLRLFAEVLRMLDDVDGFEKMKVIYHTDRQAGTVCPLCGRKEGAECI